LLLPECLPFISELLEDDNAEVVACTRNAITAIEEISGESLDSYLKN
jgi:U3 small nucleolar RNA-associated protein 10